MSAADGGGVLVGSGMNSADATKVSKTPSIRETRGQRRKRAKGAARQSDSVTESHQHLTTNATSPIDQATESLRKLQIQQRYPGIESRRRLHTDATASKQNADPPQMIESKPPVTSKPSTNGKGTFQKTKTAESQLPLAPAMSQLPGNEVTNMNKTDRPQYRFKKPRPPTNQITQTTSRRQQRHELCVAEIRPAPTKAYLDLAQEIPSKLPKPRRLLVVLDVNGLLGHKTNDGRFIVRPRCIEFLRYIHSQHVLMIWSSAPKANILKRCIKLFEGANVPLPQHIWSRETWQLPAQWVTQRVELFKELSWVWKAEDVQTSVIDGQQWDQTNTVLIDDDEYKGLAEPSNLIKVPSYEGHRQDKEDVLGKVVEYLEEIRWQKNVSGFISKNAWRWDEYAPPLNWDDLLEAIEVDKVDGDMLTQRLENTHIS